MKKSLIYCLSEAVYGWLFDGLFQPSSSESINQAPDRRILTGKPSDVLLNLLNVTKKIFAYLPVDALHSCLDVCETFSRLGQQELETRSRAFVMARKTANAASAMDLLGQLFTRQYDHFLCEPRLIIALKTKTLHRKSSKRGGEVFMRIAASLSPTPGARACFPRDSVNHEMIVGDNIFYLYPGGSMRFCTFSALQIPIIPGMQNGEKLIDWLIDLSVAWLTFWSIDWLIGWLIDYWWTVWQNTLVLPYNIALFTFLSSHFQIFRHPVLFEFIEIRCRSQSFAFYPSKFWRILCRCFLFKFNIF